jgi:hypothetical protein
MWAKMAHSCLVSSQAANRGASCPKASTRPQPGPPQLIGSPLFSVRSEVGQRSLLSRCRFHRCKPFCQPSRDLDAGVLCWRRYGGEPVWFPCGPAHMGTTPGSRRNVTKATPRPKSRGAGVAWAGLGIPPKSPLFQQVQSPQEVTTRERPEMSAWYLRILGSGYDTVRLAQSIARRVPAMWRVPLAELK